MKVRILFFTMFSTLLILKNSNAQIGSTCSNPHLITSLPFSQTGLSTQNTGDHYDEINGIPRLYMSGNDYVFKFVPNQSQSISIKLSGTNAPPFVGGVGLYILNGCPDIITSICLDSATANNNPEIQNFNVTMGMTYYIIVSSIAPMFGNPYINFNIDITTSGGSSLYDVGVVEIYGIQSGCGLGSDTIKAKVANFGNMPVSFLTVAYKVNNSNEVTKNIGFLSAGDTIDVIFSTPYNFSNPGTYIVKCYTKLMTDNNHSNDTSTKIITNIQPISTFPYVENFENNNGNWTPSGTSPSWEWGVANKTKINDTNTGNRSWVTSLDTTHNQGENSYLVSPCFDFSSLISPSISFNIWHEGQMFVGSSTTLEYSIDNGNTWSVLGSASDPDWYNSFNGFSGSSQNWKLAKHSLANLAGEPKVIFRFHFTSGFMSRDEGVAIDNITITEATSNDLGVIDILKPTSGCGLSSTEQLKVKVVNFGIHPKSNFPIKCKVNNSLIISETANVTINAEDTIEYTFTNTLDLSIPGTYKIAVYTDLNTDTDNSNDTAYKSITSVPFISTFPYYENFENGDGGFYPQSSSSANTWQLGTPNAPIINHAASGTNAWVTNLTGNHAPNENSWVVSPCFDLSSLTLPMLEIKVWYALPTLASSFIEYSKDGGQTWTTVRRGSRHTNWYNTTGLTNGWTGNSNSWITAYTTLDSLIGANNVIFRIHFNGQLSFMGQSEGLAFDDFKIIEAPQVDLGVIAITKPQSNCGLSANEQLIVKIKNYATSPQSNFTIGYIINNGTPVIETANITINPGDTATYTYSNTLNLSTPGTYQIKAFTALSNDAINSNDTSKITIISTPIISTFPYSNNFETNDGYWVPGGTNSSWEYGTPAGNIINNAASGTKVWGTNLDGNYQTNENSWLKSPCFDFSNLANPVIQFKLWTEIGSLVTSGYLRLESSIDGGATWQTVGTAGDDVNWYNSNNGWNGSSGGWFTASHTLDNLGGLSNVILRFVFNGGGFLSSASEGVAIDDIVIRDACLAPVANFTYNANGSTISFINLSSNATSYLWNFGDGTTSTQTNPTHTYSNAGTYFVKLIASNSCGQDSVIKQITITGIEEFDYSNFIKIYPNPASQFIHIKIENTTINDYTVELHNLLGETIYSEKFYKISNSTVTIPVNNIPSGTYFIKIKNDKYSKSFMLNIL